MIKDHIRSCKSLTALQSIAFNSPIYATMINATRIRRYPRNSDEAAAYINASSNAEERRRRKNEMFGILYGGGAFD